jgi:hypothetical protein
MANQIYTSPYEPHYGETYPEHPNCFQCGTSLTNW